MNEEYVALAFNHYSHYVYFLINGVLYFSYGSSEKSIALHSLNETYPERTTREEWVKRLLLIEELLK